MRSIRILGGFVIVIISSAVAAVGQVQSQTPASTSPPAVAASRIARERAWAILKGGLGDKNTEKRTAAVRVLGLISADPQAAQIAEQALHDAKYEVRAAAATALGQMGATSSIRSLKGKLSDAEPSVVLAAAHAFRS